MLLIQDPALLMLDEPVAGMSVSERQKTAELLQTVIQHRSVLVIEHDMGFVEDIAHKVTVLHQGKVISEGSIAHVKADPKVVEGLSWTLSGAAAHAEDQQPPCQLRPERGPARARFYHRTGGESSSWWGATAWASPRS